MDTVRVIRVPVVRATQVPGGLHTTALVVRHIQGPAVHAMRVPEVPGMTALAALPMMVLVVRHIQGPAVHAMRVPEDRATQAPGERAEHVQQYANDSKSIQCECHLTSACRATRRKRRAPEAGR